MSGPLGVLLRVKKLKEDQAFRRVLAKRGELSEADKQVELARRKVEESAATLMNRMNSAYSHVIGRDVEIVDIDVVKGRVLRIEQDHAGLVDDCERSLHVRSRIEEELTEAAQQHRLATRLKDKYVILNDDAEREVVEVQTAREEGEVEDIFGARRTKLA